MFEKEAEEYADKKCGKENRKTTGWVLTQDDFQKGAEFGYNKANEWHYTKYELPPEDVPLLCMRGGNIYVAWFILGKWKGDKYNDVKKPYAWKEIVLPELPKESK